MRSTVANWSERLTRSRMRVRIVEGPGSPWEGRASVDSAGMVIGGEGYCPLDDLRGVVIVEATEHEQARLVEHGFDLPMEQ